MIEIYSVIDRVIYYCTTYLSPYDINDIGIMIVLLIIMISLLPSY